MNLVVIMRCKPKQALTALCFIKWPFCCYSQRPVVINGIFPAASLSAGPFSVKVDWSFSLLAILSTTSNDHHQDHHCLPPPAWFIPIYNVTAERHFKDAW